MTQSAANHIISEKILLLKTNMFKKNREEYLQQIETDDQVEIVIRGQLRVEKKKTCFVCKQNEEAMNTAESKQAIGNDSIKFNQPNNVMTIVTQPTALANSTAKPANKGTANNSPSHNNSKDKISVKDPNLALGSPKMTSAMDANQTGDDHGVSNFS